MLEQARRYGDDILREHRQADVLPFEGSVFLDIVAADVREPVVRSVATAIVPVQLTR